MEHSQDQSGKQVGDYRLLRRLGGGGFGEVYLAEDLREHRQVALKMLKTPLTSRDNLKAFLNEVRSFRLKHPFIVPLLDIGMSEQDLPFLVMEYVDGGTLRQRYPKGTHVPLDVVVRMTAQVASALQYAHDRHLMHRDVKPENMLWQADGTVLLSDFGLVEVAHASSSVSVYQLFGGTLPYMAPEQHAGKPRAASDQYALAVVVYEWLAGARPFQGTAPEIALQHLHALPPSLRDQVPALPIAVEQVVFKALAKQPQDRFARVQDFAAALQAASQLTVAPPPTMTTPPPVPSASFPESAPSPLSPSSPTAAATSDWSQSASNRPAQPAQEPEATPSFPTPSAPLSNGRDADPPPAISAELLTASPDHAEELTPPLHASPSTRQRRRSSGRVILLVILTVFLIGSGILAYTSIAQNQATDAVNATATATANAVATSRAQATAVANDLATVQASDATATAQVQATAGVLQTATAGQPTYSDSLTAGNVLDTTWMNDGTSCFFASDGYHVHLDPSPPPANGYSCTESDRSYRDSAITVNMIIRGGNSGGLLFRLQNNRFPNILGYFFEVGIGGNYEIQRVNAGSLTTLQDWTDSTAINGGRNSLNTLQVIAHGSDFLFYVNGVYLTQVQDATYGVGDIGFDSQTDTTGPGEAVFSNLHVYLYS
jgi:serine/threonine protein kinase